MPIREQGTRRPRLASDAFVAPNAEVVGDVTMAERTGLWFSGIVRANGAPITIGVGTDVQDNCLVDSEPGHPTHLGNYTSMGHGAAVHGSVVGDHVLIAMNATVMLGCEIGSGSIVAANAKVPGGTTVPPGSLVVGEEGRVVREVSEEERDRIERTAEHYMKLAREYRAALGGPA
ncbi:MAG TPA: gamma carbonic anhydrase family protein [Chloroflexota bacterium]|nr:gamma carbonic anhydrase family protein [Chloroflexota bacterium]